ncbi:alkaline phosphatase family protein [Brevibacillus sp. H7]|uniref:alkaline phosphatase family protein n=1 Tax=Brevibacillus sp. H7 TaxID=3349138 RepID=UPI00381AD474
MATKVIMVVVDGLQFDTAVTQMGYLNHLVELGKAARFQVKSELPSLSRPLYEVLLTGTPSSVNLITSNQAVRRSSQVSLFQLVKERGLRTAAAAYYWVSELYNRAPFHHAEDRFQTDEENLIQYGLFYFDDAYPDSHLLLDGELLRRRYDPDFLYIHPMGVDHAGHLFGSDSKQYRGKAIEMDSHLATLLPVWMEAGCEIVITSDHGMNRDGQHGGTGDEERLVPLYTIASRVAPGVYPEPVPQLAVAPLVCQLFGIEPPAAMMPYEWPFANQRGHAL